MDRLKTKVKSVLPRGLQQGVANKYHLLEAVIANIRFGFPARKLRVVMITGTNGKTTTAAYVGKILEAGGHRVGIISTAFYQFGDKVVPNEDNMTVIPSDRLQRLIKDIKKAGCDFLILEATSHSLIQHRLWGIPCEVAVMTNLTQDHLDYHGSMENYAAAKAKLFAREPRFIVLNRDDQWFSYFNEYHAKEAKMDYGTDGDSECRIEHAALHRTGSDIRLRIDSTVKFDFHNKLPGKFNVYNATAAVAATYLLHVDLAKIKEGVESLESVAGRLEHVNEGQLFEVIVDYAHTPDALQNVLSTVKALVNNRLILVFGATGDRDRAKRPIMGEIAVKFADRIILTDEESYSENPDVIRDDVRRGIERVGGAGKTDEVADRKEAIKKAIQIARRGDAILITGMGHERFRVIGSQRIPWNDADVARQLLHELKKSPVKPTDKQAITKEKK
ncbi:MAG TPA: UDP-N-acetylmuramoyl-L-alanyl-D-glutamate--2,6-diaminopimelate ligase [Candidatus Saccharimonadales bacterium]|nr:UDP-N-acetylmuramoyl-L-alanyl-D-glutamate--2,6-diaminopimelate ligase [Candidatus Saccharimonadales bacterium]